MLNFFSSFGYFFELMLLLKNIDADIVFLVPQPEFVFLRIKSSDSESSVKFGEMNNFIF